MFGHIKSLSLCPPPPTTSPHPRETQDAVIALADTARAAVDAVGADGQQGTKASLMTLETAVELLEDSEELMMAVGESLRRLR